MDGAPDPDWYLDNVLLQASPGGPAPLPALPAAHWQDWWRRQQQTLDPRVAGHVQGFVLRRDALGDLGVPDPERRRLVRRGAWSVPIRGVVAPLAVPVADVGDVAARLTQHRREHALSATAAVLARPGQVASARSAAIVHGLPTFRVPDRPELNAAAVTAGRHGRPIVRVGALTDTDVTSWFGSPVTTVARTLTDLARHDARDAIMAADAALREGLVTRRDIEISVEQAHGWPGVRRARDVLAQARAEAESPLESLLRLALHDSGFPPPQLQVELGGYRVDLLWPHARLVLEADGRGKNSESERWREKQRDLRLTRLGYRVERVVWDDVAAGWSVTSAYLRRVLTSRLPPPSNHKSREFVV